MSGNKTFCPQCGAGVPVDEDGCCRICGANAMGDGVDTLFRYVESALASLALASPCVPSVQAREALCLAIGRKTDA